MWALLPLALGATFEAYDAASGPEARAIALFDVIDDDAQSEDHAQAWARMGTTLSDADLDGAALIAFSKAFELDADGTSKDAERAIEIADAIGDHALVTTPLVSLERIPAETDARSRIAYLIARQQLRDDHLGAALTWIAKVDKESPSFADSEGLRGVVLASQGKPAESLAPFQTARALGVTQRRGERFDIKMLMNVSRAYYANKNWGQAIYQYSLVPRESEYWAEAHFERAWAHFRGADMRGVLGLTTTHASPFLEKHWFPEAHLLRAQAMFYLCKFGSAVTEMDTFEGRYAPVKEQLDNTVSSMSAVEAWADVTGWLDGERSKLPEMVLRPYRSEDRLAEARQAVIAYRAEAGSTSSLGAASERVAGWASGRADAIEEKEGARVLSRARRQASELEELLTGLELARIDILQLESRLYEQAAATGTLEQGGRVAKLRDLRKQKRDHQVWPFQGEYWVDELGWYQVDATSACPASMARKVGE